MPTDHDAQQDLQPPSETPDAYSGKRPWQQPKLTFVKPELTNHGRLDVVSGAFGTFNP